jgi:hypothetical protein
MIKETLEEAAENYAKQFNYAEDSDAYSDFIEGAKWQAKRMYSEEDMKKAIKFGLDGLYGYQMGEDGYFDNQVKRFLKEIK